MEKIIPGSDKGTHYYVEAAPYRIGGPPRRVKIKRHLCIGGPFDGVYRSRQELIEAGLRAVYTEFNNAGTSIYSMVFLYSELFPK